MDSVSPRYLSIHPCILYTRDLVHFSFFSLLFLAHPPRLGSLMIIDIPLNVPFPRSHIEIVHMHHAQPYFTNLRIIPTLLHPSIHVTLSKSHPSESSRQAGLAYQTPNFPNMNAVLYPTRLRLTIDAASLAQTPSVVHGVSSFSSPKNDPIHVSILPGLRPLPKVPLVRGFRMHGHIGMGRGTSTLGLPSRLASCHCGCLVMRCV
jgi:hypothetical protein